MTDNDRTRPSRDVILAKVRQHILPAAALPELPAQGIEFVDRWTQFSEVLAAVGGHALPVAERSGLEAAIRALPVFVAAKSIVCRVPDLRIGNRDMELVENARDLADIDLAIMPGLFAVAENAAVWVSGNGLRHRAVYFLAQHLVLVVQKSQCIDHMHQAYQRLSFSGAGYGLFISGPSKTADIEQSLVIGAHGPRSLTVAILPD